MLSLPRVCHCHPERHLASAKWSRKPALSESAWRTSRTGTCGCFSRSSPTKKMGAPGPSHLETGDRDSTNPNPPLLAIFTCHDLECPIHPLFSADGWDSTNPNPPLLAISTHHRMGAPGSLALGDRGSGQHKNQPASFAPIAFATIRSFQRCPYPPAQSPPRPSSR